MILGFSKKFYICCNEILNCVNARTSSNPTANLTDFYKLINSGSSSKSLITVTFNSPFSIKLIMLDEKKRNTIMNVVIDAMPPTSL